MTDIMTSLGKQPGDDIDYDDVDTLRALLAGQQITAITETTAGEIEGRADGYGRDEYDKVIEYHLASGVTLRAHARDGGCGCTNGCFTVDVPHDARQKLIGATIMNVTTEEKASEGWSENPEVLIVDGNGEPPFDGSSEIKVFAYLPGIDEPAVLVESAGSDNGYYGWGFHFSIVHPVLVVQEQLPRALEGGDEPPC